MSHTTYPLSLKGKLCFVSRRNSKVFCSFLCPVLNGKLGSSSVFKPDPYVCLTLDTTGESFRTSYKHSTNHPEWNDAFTL